MITQKLPFTSLIRQGLLSLLFALCIMQAGCGAVGQETLAEWPQITRFESTTMELSERVKAPITLYYVNPSGHIVFTDVIIVMSFDEDLLLDEDLNPGIEQIGESTTQVQWTIGDLLPNETGTLPIIFEVDNRIDPSECELTARIEIQSRSPEGQRRGMPYTLNIPIQGRLSCNEIYQMTREAVLDGTGTVALSDLLPPRTGVPIVTPLPTSTISASPTPTVTLSPTPTPTDVPTPTLTNTATPEPTLTSTVTSTPTITPTHTPTSTPTATETPTVTETVTSTQTLMPSIAATTTITATSTNESVQPTATPETIDASNNRDSIQTTVTIVTVVLTLVAAALALTTELLKLRKRD